MEYLITQKLKDEGKTLELDESEHIKGWDDILSGMKTQKPDQFEKAGGGKPNIDPNPLPIGDPGKPEPTSLADALRQQFESGKE
jgi:hypothetical protein